MTTDLPPYMLFLDLETTGLDPDTDKVIEVAAFVASTDYPFNIIGDPVSVLVPLSPSCPLSVVRNWPEPVRAMHQKSGLLNAAVLNAPDHWAKEVEAVAGADNRVCNMIASTIDFAPEGGIPLAGYGVSHMEAAGWLAKHLPRTAGELAYWSIDVSNLRRTLQMFGYQVDPKGSDHRAILDCHAAHMELVNMGSMMRSSTLGDVMGLVADDAPAT